MAEVLLNGLGYESKQTSAVQPIIFAAQESQLMVPIMERQTPQDVARQWLRDPSEDLQRWPGVSDKTRLNGLGAAVQPSGSKLSPQN